ncbi:MAG: hypothetical protein RBJ76_13275 [Stenomitos frigidus ULC029]
MPAEISELVFDSTQLYEIGLTSDQRLGNLVDEFDLTHSFICTTIINLYLHTFDAEQLNDDFNDAVMQHDWCEIAERDISLTEMSENELFTLCADYDLDTDDALTHALFLGLGDESFMQNQVRPYLKDHTNG